MAGKVYEIAFRLAGRLASSFSGSFRQANSAMAGLARGQKQLASSTQQATAAQNRQTEATTKATAAMAKHATALARVQSFRKKMSAAAVPAAALTAGLGAGAMASSRRALIISNKSLRRALSLALTSRRWLLLTRRPSISARRRSGHPPRSRQA